MKIVNNQLSIINRKGAALLVVLFIVMTVTILSLGFLSQSDTELACGENMLLRTQMDYLAESGLEHARGLLLSPQDITDEYWEGATGQQLVAGDDYYDVNVVKLGECNYQITSLAYREKGGEQVGRSSLQAELRLDPCIAYWQTDNQSISSAVTINGDVYCDDDLFIAGIVYGDVYARKQIIGSAAGQEYRFVSSPPVSLPGLAYSDFDSTYYIGSTQYSVGSISAEPDDITLGPTVGNPAGIYYRDGDLLVEDNVHITGMLVVKNDLKIREDGNLTVTAVKNFPALLVGHDIQVENDGAVLSITGFAQVGHHIDMKNIAGSSINVLGALYVLGDGIKNTNGCSVIIITAAPNKAAIQIWPTSDNAERWSPAADAFFKSIERN